MAVAALAATALMACAGPRPSPAALTAADVPPASSASSTSSTNADAPAHAAAAARPEAPPGELVCRAKSATDGTTELFVDWTSETPKGVLRTVAPSGMVYERRIEAERRDGIVVADIPDSMDVAVHAAVVRALNGKKHIRLGERGSAWAACE